MQGHAISRGHRLRCQGSQLWIGFSKECKGALAVSRMSEWKSITVLFVRKQAKCLATIDLNVNVVAIIKVPSHGDVPVTDPERVIATVMSKPDRLVDRMDIHDSNILKAFYPTSVIELGHTTSEQGVCVFGFSIIAVDSHQRLKESRSIHLDSVFRS